LATLSSFSMALDVVDEKRYSQSPERAGRDSSRLMLTLVLRERYQQLVHRAGDGCAST
jgi:hypothetical protein